MASTVLNMLEGLVGLSGSQYYNDPQDSQGFLGLTRLPGLLWQQGLSGPRAPKAFTAARAPRCPVFQSAPS